jgi:hypothetical protein
MFIKRSLYLFILTLILSVSTAFAQAGDDPIPCPGDPDDPGYSEYGCYLPLDTWVYVLVVAAVIFGAYKLHQKQKAVTV